MAATFNEYGKFYDILYSDKDYEKECNFIEEMFEKHASIKPKTILDVGCGTGSHAIPLLERGYNVTGLDISKDMIGIAREKAVKAKVNLDLYVMDLRDLKLPRKFDACICMFSVIGYIAKNADISKSLLKIRSCLEKNGLFIFDFWYGPAVLFLRPEARTKTVKKGDLRIERFSEPSLDTLHHTCDVDYSFLVTKGDSVLFEGKEKHVVRFFFPEEIKHYLEENGFQLLEFCPFLELNSQPNEKTWNASVIARAV